MPITARGVVVRTPGGAAAVEEIVVDDPGPGEVRVRILATGVCHTDLHAKEGNFGTEFPYLLGHEATGVVDEVGPNVTRPARGATVTLSWRSPCGDCRACLGGRPAACLRPLRARPRMRTTDGQTLGRVLSLGTFATHTVVAAAQAVPMPAELPAEATCLIGCAVVTGVGAVLYAAQLPPGATCAVFGCGAVGMSVIQGAKLAHAGRVIAVDLSAERLERARRLGATDAIQAGAIDPVARIRELTGGAGVDYAFEAVGLPRTLEQALAALGQGGTGILIGVPPAEAPVSFSMTRFFYARAALRTTFYGDCLPARDFPLMAEWYRGGKLELDELITDRIGLDGVDAAFAAMAQGKGLRSVIVMDRP